MTHPSSPPPPPGPGRMRCPAERPHDPHLVPSRGPITGFPCAGLDPAEINRQLNELFGPVLAAWALKTP